jgi:small GTP-binding protein
VRLILEFMKECYSGVGSGGGAEGRLMRLSSRTDGEGSQSGSPAKSDHHHSRRPNPSSGKRPRPVPGVDQMTRRGKTAFHEAAKYGHFETMTALLEAGADINAYMRPDLDASINVDLTALVQACLMNQPDIVRFLLKNGATDTRLKALSRSLRQSHNDVAGLLLCYNGGAHPIIEGAVVRQTNDGEKCRLGKIDVTWNSKKLANIHESWLQTVCMEVPVNGNRTPVIAHLDISSNELREIPVEVFQLVHLTRLDASRNKITSLPVSHGNERGWDCPRLSELDISSNRLTTIPSLLFLLPELKELNANDNEVTEVDISVWTAPKLNKLFLSRNRLKNFPSSSELTPSSLPQSPPTGGRCQESGYQSGTPISSSSSLLLSSQAAKSLTESQNPFDESLSAWMNRRRGSRPNTATATFGRDPRRMSVGSLQTSIMSWRFKNFQDSNFVVDELDDLESESSEEGSEGGALEHIDLSRNSLTSVPAELSCLAPKLQKLNLSHNRIRGLGQLIEFPPGLEMLDASNNELCSAITESASLSVMTPCARRSLPLSSGGNASFLESVVSPTSSLRPCSHRLHRNLQKLSTIRLSRNELVDVQLFRTVSRPKAGDLTASLEETSTRDAQRQPSNDPFAIRVAPVKPAGTPWKEALSKSMSGPHSQDVASSPPMRGGKQPAKRVGSGDTVHRGAGGSNSSNSGGSGDDGGLQSSSHTILSPLFPMLSTLELAQNNIHSVPVNIHLVSTLACLVLSHNPIESLPLELSNLEHLWNLEYEGCNLISPPKQDLDKFRLAADKLLYMKSLLHDAKPNESLKLMLVGLQKMGKTTLLSKLREVNESTTAASTFNERVKGEEKERGGSRGRKKGEILSTVGVDLGIWRYRKDLEPDLRGKRRSGKTMKSVTFYTWDFGGQEEYYVTHQCFLSTRSLYLVVWDVEKGEEGVEQLGPWLHNIQARAPGSPVVIVGTHMDRVRGEERDKRKVELSNIIKDKYLVGRGPQQQRELGLPKIRDVVYVACPSPGREEGVADLRKALYDIAFSLTLPKVGHATGTKTKLLEQPIPASFLKLEERVRVLATELKRQAEPPLLKENRFREETNDIIANPRELDQAVTFLHENGVMLHYATPALSHLYFVDPQWLCDMLAHVVTVPEVNSFIPRKDGLFSPFFFQHSYLYSCATGLFVLAYIARLPYFPQEECL